MRFIPQRHPTARLPLAVAAALAAAMLGGCTSGSPGGVRAPTVSPEAPASTPVATPTAWSPEGDFFVDVTIDLPQEGIWSTNTYSAEQARVRSSSEDAWFWVTTGVRVAEDPCARGTGDVDLPEAGPAVSELVNALAATPIASEVEETSVAGHPAWLVTFAADDASQLCEDGGYRLWRWKNHFAHGLELGAETRAWVVDVDGTRVLLVAEDRGTPEESAALQRMLDSIRLSGR
jgi:hypothetical protein